MVSGELHTLYLGGFLDRDSNPGLNCPKCYVFHYDVLILQTAPHMQIRAGHNQVFPLTINRPLMGPINHLYQQAH